MARLANPGLLFSVIIWIAITFFGAYFLLTLKSHRWINFGIDLVGGTYLTLDVKIEEAVKSSIVGSMQDVIDLLQKEHKSLPKIPQFNDKALEGKLEFGTNEEAEQALKLFKHIQVSDDVIIQEQNKLIFSFPPDVLALLQQEAILANIAILRSRLDAYGAGEIIIAPQGNRKIVIELPNVSDPEQAKARIGKTALLEIKPLFDKAASKELLLERYNDRIPAGSQVVQGKKIRGKQIFYLVPDYAKVSGRMLKETEYHLDRDSLRMHSPHSIALKFKPDGARKFYELTKENTGGQVGVIIDNEVIEVLSVEEPISGGNALISGSFTLESAQELVVLLKTGAFAAPVQVIEERHIGPSLGQESINKGLISCAIGLCLLFLFSIIVYKTAGIFAFTVLLYNLLLILFGLAIIPDAALTLPGIAGMILTVGMAIDSSILIYERIKEELAEGIDLSRAVSAGFNGATGVILDANITTFIIGAVLYYLGSPAIQGFALTMMIGIISTLITGLLLLKLIFTIILQTGIQKIKI